MKFSRFTKEEHTQALVDFLFGGQLSQSANIQGSNLRKLFMAFACENVRVEDQIATISEQHDINITTDFIEQWESAVGIPDGCFTNTGTLAERRVNVLIKLGRMNVQTIQDFLDLVQLLGFTASLTPGGDVGIFPMVFPLNFFRNEQHARFTIIVDLVTNNDTFPLPFPVQFASDVNSLVTCILNDIKPAEVSLAFRYTL